MLQEKNRKRREHVHAHEDLHLTRAFFPESSLISNCNNGRSSDSLLLLRLPVNRSMTVAIQVTKGFVVEAYSIG
jgi:hypothetical protein